MNILKEIQEDASMLDMVENVKSNLLFYLRHREDLADIKLTNEYIEYYIDELNEVIRLYEKSKVPEWFKSHNPYLFTSGGFPYVYPKLDWTFSFKEWVDILLQEGKIDAQYNIATINFRTYTAKEWRKALKN